MFKAALLVDKLFILYESAELRFHTQPDLLILLMLDKLLKRLE